jgi:peroxiredoxin
METHLDGLERLDAQVVALSADGASDAERVVDAVGLRYTVLYGLDPQATSEAIGCYTGERDGEPHIQPAAFVLDREGTVAHAVYSSGKVGRLTADDAIAVLEGLDD